MSIEKELKISIITPSYNQADFVGATIESVLNQNISEVEHIVIDGGSTDDTVSVLKKYSDVIWVSEKDKGQADALNKGIEKATGDIIGWVNSDDYYEKNIFKSVLKCFEDPEVMWVIGNISYKYEETNEIISDRSKGITFDSLIRNPDIVRQQPTFFRKTVLDKVGRWNAEFHMVMDYDLWVRLTKISNPKMVNENWAYFRFHGDQKTSLKNLLLQKREITDILNRENVSAGLIFKLRAKKRWYWIKASIKELLISSHLISEKSKNI